MPWLYTALTSFLAFLWTFASSLIHRLPVILAYIALLVAATTAYLALANNIIDSLHQTVPQIVLDVWGWVMPYNAVPCLLAILTARIYRWTYSMYLKIIERKASALMSRSV